MEEDDVDLKSNIKGEVYWLVEPKRLDHQTGKLTITSEGTEDITYL